MDAVLGLGEKEAGIEGSTEVQGRTIEKERGKIIRVTKCLI